jgi:ribonuclease BN (tRNA processing enzyme)
VRLTVIGSSPAWPNPNGAQSGYLVESSGSLLLDCGPGVLARLRDRDGGWPAVEAIVLTHWHLDHFGDLVPWVWGAMFLRDQYRLRPQLWIPPEGRDRLAALGAQLGWEDMWDAAFDIRDYAEREPFDVLGTRITAHRLPHYRLLTFGLRVEANGRVLAYSGDSGPSDRLADLARDADLFLCEATLARGDLDGDPRGHLSAEEAVAAFERSGARRLLLTHRPAELPTPPGLELAYDGLELEL